MSPGYFVQDRRQAATALGIDAADIRSFVRTTEGSEIELLDGERVLLARDFGELPFAGPPIYRPVPE